MSTIILPNYTLVLHQCCGLASNIERLSPVVALILNTLIYECLCCVCGFDSADMIAHKRERWRKEAFRLPFQGACFGTPQAGNQAHGS